MPLGGAAEVIDLAADDSDSEDDDDDGVIDLSNYIFTSEEEDEEDAAGDEDSGSELEVEWELEIVGEQAAPKQPPAPPAIIDLTADAEDGGDSAAAAASAPSGAKRRRHQIQLQKQQKQQQREQRQRRQQREQHEQQQQQQREAERQRFVAAGTTLITVFIDGSHRPQLKPPLLMSAGVWCPQHKVLQTAWLLQGGMPDSIRAELGALFASAVRLKTTLDHQIIQKPDAVHILTDCKACVSFLMPGAAVKAKYEPLVTATRARLQELRQLVPITLKWVKGHQTGQHFEAVGNNAAHRLAKHCDAHSAVCQLPVGPVEA